MSGNKHDNGVHEVGKPETRKAYQEDTPGQQVEKYLASINEVIEEKKEKQKKSFMKVFDNPLKGFPYNEELDDNLVNSIQEDDKRDGDPCWKGYKQVGMKKKGGKEVPNCVPMNEEELEKAGIKKEDVDYSHLEEAYKPVKKNHYDVVVRDINKKDAKAIFNFTKNFSDRLDIEDIDADQITGSGMSSWSDGDMYIQGDDAGKVGLEVLKKFKSKGIKVLGESVEIKEGKYAKYSDLLMKKAKEMQAIDKAQNKSGVASPSLNALKSINKEIEKEMKKLGITESINDELDEGKNAKFLELKFRDKNEAIKAYRTVNNKIFPGGTQPFEDFVQEGSYLQFDNVQDVKSVLNAFKKGGLKFKIEVQESLKEGKYAKYSDLLMKKAKEMQAIDKAQNKSGVASPSLNALKSINKEIEKEMKKLGITESINDELDEGKMGDLFLDIQQGATAKEIAKNYPVSMQQAKDFLKDYYSQKKRPMKMGEETEILRNYDSLLEAKDLMPDIKKIVDTKSATKVGGVMLDMFTASMILTVYDKVNDQNKGRMEKSNIQTLVHIAHKVMGVKESLAEIKLRDVDGITEVISDEPDAEHDQVPTPTPSPELDEAMKIQDIFKKHKRELNKAYKTGDLSFSGSAGKKAEDDLTTWALNNNEIKSDDPDEFFDWLSRDLEDIVKGKIKEDVSEKYKPYSSREYPRCIDFYVQFRGGKGDRITSEENKKDFIKATDMIDAYCRKNKIRTKPVYSTPMEGSSAYKVGLMINGKSPDYKNGVDLQPLYVALSKLKTAEDHGGGWDKASIKESNDLQEGTWSVPDSYPKLVALQKFLRKPHKAKTAKDVLDFTNDVYSHFGDDSFFDDLGAYGTTLPGGEKDFDGTTHSAEYMKRAEKYNKIKKGTDLNLVLIKQLGDWTGNVLKFKGVEMVEFPREWYLNDNPKHKKDDSPVKAKLESVEEGKGMKRGSGNLRFKRQGSIKVEGKMDGGKLTGQEISVYFRRNKVRDKQTRKAVEIALDHGGAMSYAIKQIEKLKKGLSKDKDVQKALNYANFGESVRVNEVGFQFKEDSPIAGNMQVEGDPYIPQKKGVNKNIANYWNKEIKGLKPKELEAIQSMYMITDHSGVVQMYKAGKRAFIKSIKD